MSLIRHRCIACTQPSDLRLCDRCLPTSWHRLGVDGPAVLGQYDGPVGQAVRRIKVRRDTHLAEHLCQQATRRIDHLLGSGPWAAVVPAPSLWHTRLLRGFSLASILAHHVGRHTGLPVRHVLRKSGWRKQSGLSRQQRSQQALHTIRCTRRITGRILLVDDVWTTGATARACGYQLGSAGAENVAFLALCAVQKNRSRSH